VIAPKDNFTSKLISEGIDFREIEMKNYGINPISELKLILTLIRLYKEIKPDLVFHYTIKPNIYGSFAASYCKVPSIIITTGLGHLFEFKNFFVSWLTLNLYQIACSLSNEIWFLNTNDMDVFTYKGIVNKSKTRLIKGEGIDTSWFKLTSNKKIHEIKTFLFAGRLLKDKGVKEYVEAAKILLKKHKNVQFNVLGFIDQSNPNSIPYQDIFLWQKDGIINYLGETTDVRPYLEETTCLVFPSYYREGISRILMEAASMETPIITTDNVGCKDIVDHDVNGYLCEIKNVNALVACMEQFLTLEDNDMITMGKLGRKKMIKLFDEQLIIKSYDLAIKNILHTSQKRSVKLIGNYKLF